MGGTQVPFPYGQLVDFFDFVTLDLVSFVPFGRSFDHSQATSHHRANRYLSATDCLYTTTFDHFHALILESISPLAVLAAAKIIKQCYRAWLKCCAHLTSTTLEPKLRHRIMANYMTVLFFILPVISRRICQSFRCTDYDDGKYQYLVQDT